MKSGGGYNRDLVAEQEMAGSNTVPAQESKTDGKRHREKEQYGFNHDGREEGGVAGRWTSASIPRLQYNKTRRYKRFKF